MDEHQQDANSALMELDKGKMNLRLYSTLNLYFSLGWQSLKHLLLYNACFNFVAVLYLIFSPAIFCVQVLYCFVSKK